MNWTAFPFSRGALAAALVLIPGAPFMTGCMADTNLTGGNGSTEGASVGGMGGTGATGATGGSSSMGGGGMGGSGMGGSGMGGSGGGMGGSGGGMGGSGGGGASIGSWSKRFGSVDSDIGSTTAVDNAGNVVVTGLFASTIDFGGGPLVNANVDIGSDIFLAKFDSSGNHLWSKPFGTVSSTGDAIDVDSAGNVAIAGCFRGTADFGGGPFTAAGGNDIFVAKFDPNGNHVWSKRFGDAGNDCSLAVVIDSAGDVAITGRFEGTVDFGGGPLTTAGSRDIFMAKFDPNGNHVWSKRFGDVSDEASAETAIDSAGNIVLTGSFMGTVDFGGGPLTPVGSYDIFVAKFDPNGNHVWSKRFGGTGNSAKTWAGTAIDSAGNVAIAGRFDGTVDFGGGPLTTAGSDDIFVAKFDPNGNHVWSKRFGGTGVDAGLVAIDSAGNIVLTGSFSNLADFGGGPLTTPDSDAFVAKLDPSGNHLWSAGFGNQGAQFVSIAAIDNAGSVLVTGGFHNTVDFGNGPLVSAGGWDVFLAKLTP